MIVMKFGGTVLHHEAGFQSMIDIINSRTDQCLIVVSAFSDITRKIDSAMKLALDSSFESAENIIDSIMEYHKSLSSALLPNNDVYPETIDHVHAVCNRLLRGIQLTGEISQRTRDLMLSKGEYLASTFIHHLLKQHNIASKMLDATAIIKTNNDHGNAKPIEFLVRQQVQDHIISDEENYDVFIIAGFIGSDMEGNITTMGYESSNLTASLLGCLLEVDEIIIWTDVSGIRSIDPKLSSKSIGIPECSFQIAQKLADYGLKLLHHWMIELPMQYSIPVSIRNAYDDSEGYTKIHSMKIEVIPQMILYSEYNGRTSITIVSDKPEMVTKIYEIGTELSKHHSVEISTYVLPYLHTINVDHEQSSNIIQTLHSLIEDTHETSS